MCAVPSCCGVEETDGREKNSIVFIFRIRKNKSCVILNRSAKWVSVNAIKCQQIREEKRYLCRTTSLLPSSGFCFKLVLDLWVWGLVSEQSSSSTLELSRWHLSMTPVLSRVIISCDFLLLWCVQNRVRQSCDWKGPSKEQDVEYFNAGHCE